MQKTQIIIHCLCSIIQFHSFWNNTHVKEFIIINAFWNIYQPNNNKSYTEQIQSLKTQIEPTTYTSVNPQCPLIANH
ncbi:hypothetical protein HMPREF9447_03051 [Bacteroides oleiciplenus YIT 12058]|uniref:Uncharacterized protein n=1 Tax=Bacteroides oleiciplenus YIT 12058 TaxID=742727 RepID=K9DYV4_9BACE|nr:hypothetical protein HMPREF9447_03051 [Bacteroides oleiciplenus YIT 12058]